tara:strand:- start:70 stop:345 length:276 start_codon:yes stop_codon:yes gene_type:complete
MDYNNEFEPELEIDLNERRPTEASKELMRLILQLKRENHKLKEQNQELITKVDYVEEQAELREAEILATIKDILEDEGVEFDIDDFVKGLD